MGIERKLNNMPASEKDTESLIVFTDAGMYCPRADVYIDPWKPVPRAILTHAHSDHARQGMGSYLAHTDSAGILKYRLGDISLQTVDYDMPVTANGVHISLHPAGHVQGSAQVRFEHNGVVWVISGDYKVLNDGYTVPFEPVRCHHFVTECTFGLPVYHFPSQLEVRNELNAWVKQNMEQGFNSVIIGYALGKAQRILHSLEPGIPVLLHTTIYNTNEALGIDNGPWQKFTDQFDKEKFSPGVIVATGSVMGSPWLRRFEPYKLAVCSGWMALRGTRRRRNVDKGLVMSDHADWKGLNEAVLATGAENIYVTHGYKQVFARWLREQHQLNAIELETLFEGEASAAEASEAPAEPS